MSKTTNDSQRVVTGTVRLSYVHVFAPYARADAEPRYSVTILIPKRDTTTMNNIYAAIEAAKQEGLKTVWGGKAPLNPPNPIHDGDGLRESGEPYGAECKGHYVLTASTKIKPQVVDANLQPIITETEVYSGCYGYVSIRFFPYAASGKKGIGAGLGNIMKTAEGEALGNYATAEDDFAPQRGAQPSQPAYAPQTYAPAPTAYPQPAYAPQTYAPAPTAYPTQINPITGAPMGGVMGL